MHPHTTRSGFLHWLHHLSRKLCGRSQGRDQTTNRDEVKGSSGTQTIIFVEVFHFMGLPPIFNEDNEDSFKSYMVSITKCNNSLGPPPKVPKFTFVHIIPKMKRRSSKGPSQTPEILAIGENEALNWLIYTVLMIWWYQPIPQPFQYFFIRIWQVQNDVNFPLVAGFLANFVAELPFKLEVEASISCSWFSWLIVHL